MWTGKSSDEEACRMGSLRTRKGANEDEYEQGSLRIGKRADEKQIRAHADEGAGEKKNSANEGECSRGSVRMEKRADGEACGRGGVRTRRADGLEVRTRKS